MPVNCSIPAGLIPGEKRCGPVAARAAIVPGGECIVESSTNVWAIAMEERGSALPTGLFKIPFLQPEDSMRGGPAGETAQRETAQRAVSTEGWRMGLANQLALPEKTVMLAAGPGGSVRG